LNANRALLQLLDTEFVTLCYDLSPSILSALESQVPCWYKPKTCTLCGSHNIGCTYMYFTTARTGGILFVDCSIVRVRVGNQEDIRLRQLSIQEDTQSYQKLPEVAPSHEWNPSRHSFHFFPPMLPEKISEVERWIKSLVL